MQAAKKLPIIFLIWLLLALLPYNNLYALNALVDDSTDSDDTTALTAAGSNSGDRMRFSGAAAGLNEIFTIEDNLNVGSSGSVVQADTLNGVGTVTFLGTSTATGVIGATGNRLGLLQGGAAGETVTFTTGDIFAIDINFTGTGQMSFDSDITVTNDIDFNNNAGTLTFADNADVTGAIDNSGGTGGSITFSGTSTVSGTIGTTNAVGVITGGATGEVVTFLSAVDASDINFSGTGTISLGGTATITNNIDFRNNAGTLSVADNANVTGAIDNTLGTGGILTFLGTTTVSGAVGSTNRVGTITGGATGETLTFSSTVAASDITFSGTGGISLGGNTNITNDVDFNNNAGTLTLADNVTITGAVDNTGGTGGAITFSGTGGITGAVGSTNAVGVITGGAATETVTFSSTVAASDITFSGTGGITLNGNTTITNDVDFNNNAGTLTIGDNATLTGAVDNTGGTGGAITFSGTGEITSTIGATNAVGVITAGAASETVTLSGVVSASDITFSSTGTIALGATTNLTNDIDFNNNAGTLQVAAGLSVNADIDNTGGSGGNVTFLGASTITGTMGATNALGTATLSGSGTTVSVTGNIAATTYALADNNLSSTGGTITTASGSTITSTINSTSAYGNMTSNGNATVDANTTLTLALASDAGYIPTGTNFTILDGNNAGSGVSDLSTTITDNSAILSFSQVTTNDADLVVQATRSNSYDKIASSNNASNVGATLESIGTAGASGDMSTVLAAIDALPTTTAIADAIDQMTPETTGAVVTTSVATQNRSLGVVATRLASLRQDKLGYGTSGMAAGNNKKQASIWGKGFVNIGDQDERKGHSGYDAETYGGAVGFDKFIPGLNMIVGTAYSYAASNINATGTREANGTDIKSHQVTLYGSYEKPSYFLEGMFNFATNKYESKRAINFTNVNRVAIANYDGWQTTTKFGGGYNYNFYPLVITPTVSLQHTYLNIDKYTETGAGSLNLSVEEQDYDQFVSALGGKVVFYHNAGFAMIIPELRAAWLYDFVGDTQETTATFTGGGASFVTSAADAQQHSGNFGASLTIDTIYDMKVSADYDLELKDKYEGHSGFLTLRYTF